MTKITGPHVEDAELLSAAIQASGRTVSSFAKHVLGTKNERTIWRWLNGQNNLTPEHRERCRQILAAAQAIAPVPPAPAPAPHPSTPRRNPEDP